MNDTTFDFEKPIEFSDWKETFIFTTNEEREQAIKIFEKAGIKYCVPKVASDQIDIPYFLQVSSLTIAKRALKVLKKEFRYGDKPLLNVVMLPSGVAIGHGYECYALTPKTPKVERKVRRRRVRRAPVAVR